jgi:hypothetical protein
MVVQHLITLFFLKVRIENNVCMVVQHLSDICFGKVRIENNVRMVVQHLSDIFWKSAFLKLCPLVVHLLYHCI